jgi:Na+-driven multidrug efflux pump
VHQRRRRRRRLSSTSAVAAAADDKESKEGVQGAGEGDDITEPITCQDAVPIDRKAELAAVFAFAIPLLATNIVTPLLTMTDTAFVGRCAADSVVQLAALGVSTPLTDYTVTLAAFIPAGLTNIISNGLARGESKESLSAKTYGALIISLILSLSVAAVLNAWPEQLLAYLQTPPAVMATAVEYTRIRSFGMPAAYLTAACYAVLVARKDTTSPLACVCLAAVVNVIGDYFAVVVLGAGAAGAAWATTAALYAGCGAILLVLHRKGYADTFPWWGCVQVEFNRPTVSLKAPGFNP